MAASCIYTRKLPAEGGEYSDLKNSGPIYWSFFYLDIDILEFYIKSLIKRAKHKKLCLFVWILLFI